jgi:hypothetical protein
MKVNNIIDTCQKPIVTFKGKFCQMVETNVVWFFEILEDYQLWFFNYSKIKEPLIQVVFLKLKIKNHPV